METFIEYLITDFHTRDLPQIASRGAVLPQIPNKIDAVIGMRRSGKTYFLYQAMQEKLKAGISKKRLLYINFNDERLWPLAADQLYLMIDIYFRLFPELKKEKCYFFFDEIQNVSGWKHFVRRILEQEKVHIYLAASSAKLLNKEIASTLQYPASTTEIFPFSFSETLTHEKPKFKLSSSTDAEMRALMANRLRQYLRQGGFPEVQNIEDIHRIRILQKYVDVVIFHDVIERYQVSNAQAVRALLRHILNNPATLISINKFYNDLRSQGISCTKSALYDYFGFLQDAYLIYPVQIHTPSERTRRTNLQKIYVVDTGLMMAFTRQPQPNWEQLLENFVYMELRRQGLTIEYYRTQEHTEVDFITTGTRGELALYQVAITLTDAHIREREIRSLETAMQECHLKKAYLITLDHRETLQVKTGVIEIFPAWQWAISQRDAGGLAHLSPHK